MDIDYLLLLQSLREATGGISVNNSDKYTAPKAVKILLGIVILLIAFSRNYLGVHTPQDVVVALVIGICTLFAVTKLMPVIESKKMPI